MQLPNFTDLSRRGLLWISTREKKYLLAAALDAVLIFIILFNAVVPGMKIRLPLTSPLQGLSSWPSFKTTSENFAFAPSSSIRLSQMDLTHLNALAYFDIPILADGSLNEQSIGYQQLSDPDTQDLFQRAKSHGIKIFLTMSQMVPEYSHSFLNDSAAQDQAISQTVALVKDQGADGVVIDFEVPQSLSYQKGQFSNFVAKLSDQLHSQISGSEVVIALDGASLKNSFYDIKALSYSTDKVFMMASSFAVPENNGVPFFGYSPADYWRKIAAALQSFTSGIPINKLVMEKAWYGSGDKYPLYTPSPKPVSQSNLTDSSLVIDNNLIDRLVDQVPSTAQSAAKQNLPYIISALKGEGILNSSVLSYAMATIEHETDGTFQPIEEIQGRVSARRLGYEGGEDYFGRGFIQLTHLRNYKIMGQRIGMGERLVENPDLASTPVVSAKVLAAFFKDNNVANLASSGDFIDARSPINPDRNGYRVALLAQKYQDEF